MGAGPCDQHRTAGDTVNWDGIVSIIDKIGFVAVVVFVAYLVLKWAIGFLVDQSLGSDTDAQEPVSDRDTTGQLSGDPTNDVPGLHVLSDYGAEHTFVGKSPTERTIRATIRDLDWVNGFHQVILVTAPGVSLEVGGSLDPQDGLSAMYRDWKKNDHRVTREPPTTVKNMEDLLVSFHRGDGRWEQMYTFD